MKIFYKISVPIVCLGIISIFIVYYVFASSFRHALINEEILRTSEIVSAMLQRNAPLIDANLSDPAALEKIFQESIKEVRSENSAVYRVKIWGADSRVAYAEVKSLIGTVASRPADLQRAFAGEIFGVVREITDLDANESSFGESANIFIPVKDTRGRVVFVAELFSATEAILHPTRSAIQEVIYTLIGIALFASILFFLVNYIVLLKPIYALEESVKSITKGNLDMEIRARSRDELGGLAVGLNTMRGKLKEHIASIEQSKSALVEKNKQIEEQNKSLEDTKSAVINLLKDARELEQNLTEERDRSFAIITSMGEGLFVVDKNYTIILSNPFTEKLFGVEHNALTGKDLRQVYSVYIGDKQLPDDERPIVKTFTEGKTHIIGIDDNIYLQTLAGERRFPVTSITTPLRDNDNNITGAVIVFRDITDEKKLDEMKSTFISAASHQLRTPLTSIRWYTEMLEAGDAGPLTKPQKESLSNIYSGVLRLGDTLNMLLSLARVESGRVKIEPVSTDLALLTQDVAKELAPYSDAKNLKIDIAVENAQSASVMMDQSMVRQVIMNLLSNAIRYTDNKSVILVRIKPKEDHWVYSVKDEGMGIPEESKGKVFQKFFRADNAIILVPNGNGLGLALVKSLVEIWKGKVWFESQEGKGTTFYFTIPFAGMQAKQGGKSLA